MATKKGAKKKSAMKATKAPRPRAAKKSALVRKAAKTKKHAAPPVAPAPQQVAEQPAAPAAEAATVIETVQCRYCGRAIVKPADSTFYQCDSCRGTGTLTTDKYGKPVAG